ncbi:MAG: hypothetical protein EPO28_08605 [Saprospiraceae bacterium]|nr:MAG: hypothetical protein EPO28_08605 [Saprospiraceae bacterium]
MMNSIRTFSFLFLFGTVTSLFGQTGFYAGVEIGLLSNFTEVNDPDRSPGTVLRASLNEHHGITGGYKFKKIPISIEAGYLLSYYDSKMVVKDKEPIVFGFGKPFVVKLPFGAGEFPVRLLWHNNVGNNQKFAFLGLIGFVWMRNIPERIDASNGSGEITRKVDGTNYRFQYDVYGFSPGSWDSSRIELGFGGSYKISENFSLSLRAILSLGLRPAVLSYFNFKLTTSYGSSLTDNWRILIIDRADQVALNLGAHYYFNGGRSKK